MSIDIQPLGEPDRNEDTSQPKSKIWLPEPTGKIASTLLFRHGGSIMVEGDVDHINATLDEAIADNEQAWFINPFFGTQIIVRHPEEVIVVNSDWADLEALKFQREAAKFQQAQVEQAMIQSRKQLAKR